MSRVVLVEANFIRRQALQQLLAELGAEVVAVTSAAELAPAPDTRLVLIDSPLIWTYVDIFSLYATAACICQFMVQAFGRAPGARANDGVVPLRSQLWGHLAWSGHADHLDVLGHFQDDRGSEHRDWMRSGAGFNRGRFRELTVAIARGMLEARAPL